MRKIIILQAMILTLLIVVSPVYAESADVTKIKTFIENVIQVTSFALPVILRSETTKDL